ncbi:MAG: Hpt domain-containing protein [Marinobacter sp.]|nr:Hpt domain-containing protein [Marinobacter sp.]
MNENTHLDMDALSELREVMGEEFNVLLETFINDSAQRINALHSALHSEDADALGKAAHSFKGSSMNIGATQLGHLCLKVETAGRQGDLTGVESVIADITEEFAQVRHLLEAMS